MKLTETRQLASLTVTRTVEYDGNCWPLPEVLTWLGGDWTDDRLSPGAAA